MRLPLACLVALALGLLCAFAVACGGGDDKRLIPGAQAAGLKDELDRIQDLTRDGRCQAVADHLQNLRSRVEGLPRRTSKRLKRRLLDGVEHLEQIAPAECAGQRTTTTTTTVETTTTPTTTQVPQTQTQPPRTQTQPPQTTTTPPATTPTQPAPTPGNSGGSQAPGSGSGSGGTG